MSTTSLKVVGRKKDKMATTQTTILNAAINGNVTALRKCLQNSVDINTPDQLGRTPLYLAAWRGFLQFVTLVLVRGGDPNQSRQGGSTPLTIAAEVGHLGIVDVLLKNSADPNVTDTVGRTASFFAAWKGHVDILKRLKASNADLSKSKSNGLSPLHVAVEYGRYEVVKYLLSSGGINPNIVSKNGETPIFKLFFGLPGVSVETLTDIARALLKKGADINFRNKDHQTPIFKILKVSEDTPVEKIEQLANNLIRLGADVAIVDSKGHTIVSLGSKKDAVLHALVKRISEHHIERPFHMMEEHNQALEKSVQEVNISEDSSGICRRDSVGFTDLPQYSMSSRPRGKCVLINVSTFCNENKERVRRGAQKDVDNLVHIFGNVLKFDVEVHQDLTKSNIMKTLIALSQEDHSNYDCFTCCIMSHGVLGKIEGKDGEFLQIKKITETFEASRCPTLVNKPKLFFIQACQGREPSRRLEYDDIGVESTMSQIVPEDADFLIGYATIPGCLAYRDPDDGSVYIKKLTENLERLSPQHDLMSIMTKVTEDVVQVIAGENCGLNEIPIPYTTLRRKIYFS